MKPRSAGQLYVRHLIARRDDMMQLSNGDFVGVLGLVGLVMFIALLGLWEVSSYGNFKIAQTTWVFAVVPTIAVFVIVIADSGLHPLLRTFLAVVWALFLTALCKGIYGLSIRLLRNRGDAKQ